MVASHAVRHSLPSADRLPWILPELRARAGLTQQGLADRLDASLPTVQRLESGAHPATMKRTWQLAAALGLSAVELVALVDAANHLRDRAEVQSWLDGLSWEPNPNGPLQRPALVDDLALPAPPPPEAPVALDAEPKVPLLHRSRALGLLLGQLRARVHLPIAELADLWGPSISTIKRFEGGRGTPDLRELAALSYVLGLSRTELVALAGGLLLHLGGQVPRRKHPELLAAVRRWLESLQWIPNPGRGLLASRPARYGYRPTRSPIRPETQTAQATAPAAPDDREGGESAEDPRTVLREVLVQPAALALAEPIVRGWSVVGAVVPPVRIERKSLAAVIAAELVRVLDGMDWQASPALLVRPDPFRARARSSWKPGRPLRVSTVGPGDALHELVRGSPEGPWRLVIVEGLRTLARAGLGTRQPAPQLHGAALAVLQTDPSQRATNLARLLGRSVDFTYTAADAMDAGVIPGVRLAGVLDPVGLADPVVSGGLRKPRGAQLCDDQRLDALLDAGAFGESRCTVLHVSGTVEEMWARSWLERRLGERAGRVQVGIRSSTKLRLDQPVDELVLAGLDYPATLVKQLFAALRRADLQAGLDVWVLQGPGPLEGKRRAALAAALGARLEETASWSAASWRSPMGCCTLDWLALPAEDPEVSHRQGHSTPPRGSDER